MKLLRERLIKIKNKKTRALVEVACLVFAVACIVYVYGVVTGTISTFADSLLVP